MITPLKHLDLRFEIFDFIRMSWLSSLSRFHLYIQTTGSKHNRQLEIKKLKSQIL